MTAAVVLAAEVERIAREIVASMAVFHRLNPSQRTALAAGGDILVERLHEAWAAFVAQQWKEREPKPHEGPILTIETSNGTIEIG
jgi:hypothetical protein